MGEYIVHPSYFDIQDQSRPLSPLEAMMRCDFNDIPQESSMELEARLGPIADLLEDALEKLSPIKREIVRRNILERVSIRDLAEDIKRPGGGRYSKSRIFDIRNEALVELKELLVTAGLHACGFGDSPETKIEDGDVDAVA